MYVADTHALIYYSRDAISRLGSEGRRIFARADAGKAVIYIPTIVLWEVVHLIEQGRVRPFRSFEHWCRTLDNHPGFSILPLEWLDVNEARTLPFRDPFDRLIVGTALRLDMPLITKDQDIADSRRVDTVW
jgi:PIN domain nuclease of toxin-antitoxin system